MGGKVLRASALAVAAALAAVAMIRDGMRPQQPPAGNAVAAVRGAVPAAPAPAVAKTRAAPAASAAILASAAQASAPAAAQPAPATQPETPASLNLLEASANDAFNNGQYALAMPMYRRVVANIKGQPDRQGMLEERIRVCEQAIEGGEGGSVPSNMAKLVMASDVVAASRPAAAPTTPLDSSAGPPAPAGVTSGAAGVPTGGTSSFDPTINFPMAASARKPHPAPKDGEVMEMPIKELGNFEYDPEKGGGIPADVTRLSGHLFRTHGYMMPLDQADNITEFALVPSLFNCCMGQPPQIQHTIVVHCPKGKAVSYYPDEIVVEGTLKVEEKKDDGYIISIFEMEAKSVKPAPK